MIYTDFQEQLRRHLEEASANTWANESLLHFTNEAVRELSRKCRPRQDEQYVTAVVDQQAYDLPAYTLSIQSVVFHDTDGTRIPLSRESVADTIARDIGASGTPVAYAVDDESLYLRPAPNTAGTIRFWRYLRPAPIATTDSTDEVPYSDDYATALEYYVYKRAFEQVNDWQSANEYAVRYKEALEDVMAQEAIEDSANMSAAPIEVY